MAFLLAYPSTPPRSSSIYLEHGGHPGAVSGGFGVAGLVAAARGNAVDGTDLVTIAGLAWLLSIAMIGTGMMVSVFTRRSSTATGLGLVLWLVFVLLGNLGLMGTSVATRVSDQVLFLAAVANPVEAFRLAAITTLGGSLDALGPVGTYAIDTFADATRLVTVASLVVWAVVPVAVGAFFFPPEARPVMRSLLALVALAVVSAIVAACGGSDESGPPGIELGRDTCDQCHMIISELRYASAYRDANGKPFVFDDISEMLEHVAGNGGATGKTVWVHDYDTEKWIDAIGAWYVQSDDIRTPMGGGSSRSLTRPMRAPLPPSARVRFFAGMRW
jgi:nitrous oxide reductase accessory protein NosL